MDERPTPDDLLAETEPGSSRGIALILIALGMALIAVRALLRAWVASSRNVWVLPYPGWPLLVAGAVQIVLGFVLLAIPEKGSAGRSRAKTALWLIVIGDGGLAVAAVSSAWMHVSRLAVPGGWMHPRALVLTSLALQVAALVLLIGAMAARRGGATATSQD